MNATESLANQIFDEIHDLPATRKYLSLLPKKEVVQKTRNMVERYLAKKGEVRTKHFIGLATHHLLKVLLFG